jgi:hypothetical protein
MPKPSSTPRSSLAELLDLQDGVATRRQLQEYGYDESAVRAQLEARRWQGWGRSVVVLHNGPLTTGQRWWVAVLAQRRGALAGPTAATSYGVKGFDDGFVHVLIPYGARPHTMPGVRVHVTRRFGPETVNRGRILPTVRIERALVDAASWMANERKACAVLAAGVQQRVTTAERLRGELASADHGRYHRLLTRILGDIEGGAASFAEIDFARFARRAGLPPPKRQVFRYDRAGRRRWLDADCDGFSVEIDGAVHLRALRYWDDMERQNDLILATGKPILRFSTVAFRIVPQTVIAQLAEAGRRFGRTSL